MASVGAALGGFSSRQRAVEGQWFNTEGQLALMRHLEKMVQQVGNGEGNGRGDGREGLLGQVPHSCSCRPAAALRHPPCSPTLAEPRSYVSLPCGACPCACCSPSWTASSRS